MSKSGKHVSRNAAENGVSCTANRTKATAHDDGRESVTEIIKSDQHATFSTRRRVTWTTAIDKRHGDQRSRPHHGPSKVISVGRVTISDGGIEKVDGDSGPDAGRSRQRHGDHQCRSMWSSTARPPTGPLPRGQKTSCRTGGCRLPVVDRRPTVHRSLPMSFFRPHIYACVFCCM